MAKLQNAVYMSPYVAAAIIEHGNRREIASGYLLGTRDSEHVYVTDYFPLTHVTEFGDVKTEAYKREVKSRSRATEPFQAVKGAAVIGWYTTGNCPSDITEEQFRIWCENPATSFNGVAVHVHCGLPSSGDLSVNWTAERMITQKDGSHGNKFDFKTHRDAILPLVISTNGDVASDVVLDYVATMALYGGKKPYASSELLNLDTVAFHTAKLPANRQPQQTQNGKDDAMPPRPMEEALHRVHDRLLAAIKNAKAGNASSAEEKKLHADILANLELIRSTKEAEVELERSATNSRDDITTQRFKDALMMKCVALMLRRDVRQLEYLAQDINNRGNKAGNNNNNNNMNRPHGNSNMMNRAQ